LTALGFDGTFAIQFIVLSGTTGETPSISGIERLVVVGAVFTLATSTLGEEKLAHGFLVGLVRSGNNFASSRGLPATLVLSLTFSSIFASFRLLLMLVLVALVLLLLLATASLLLMLLLLLLVVAVGVGLGPTLRGNQSLHLGSFTRRWCDLLDPSLQSNLGKYGLVQLQHGLDRGGGRAVIHVDLHLDL
jgi:hypothetical protein